jgi:hypothetical protein
MKSISMGVDERVELLGVLAHLSTYDGRLREALKCGPLPAANVLFQRLTCHFDAFREADAVRQFDDLTRSPSFMCDAPVKYILSIHRDAATDLFDEELIQRSGDVGALENLRTSLSRFRHESRFDEYFRANAAAYAGIVETVETWLHGTDVAGMLEAYLGLADFQYRLILAPLLIGNYGVHFLGGGCGVADGEAYAVVTPVDEAGSSFGSADHVLGFVWHEFLHAYVNALTDRFAVSGDEYARRVVVDENLRSQFYPDWKTIIDENIIRALTIQLFTTASHADHADWLLQRETERGFVFVPPLIDLLREYEKNRSEYETIVDFYPRLLSVFSGDRS